MRRLLQLPKGIFRIHVVVSIMAGFWWIPLMLLGGGGLHDDWLIPLMAFFSGGFFGYWTFVRLVLWIVDGFREDKAKSLSGG